uniref:Gamma-tubulin complex component n=2 Tax=Oryza meridionalis TaxID=40149 RepID=A0A0E0E6Q1_9ORYZ
MKVLGRNVAFPCLFLPSSRGADDSSPNAAAGGQVLARPSVSISPHPLLFQLLLALCPRKEKPKPPTTAAASDASGRKEAARIDGRRQRDSSVTTALRIGGVSRQRRAHWRRRRRGATGMRDVGTPADRDRSSSGSASTSAQAKKPASTNAEEPSSPTRGGQQQDSRRLRTLSDPELDLLISLKDLAMVCTENASLAVLGHDYDLPTLRALGIVLLETLKERLKETSIDPSVFDRLALLSDSDAHFPSIASDSESEGVRSKTPMGVNGKRKQTQAGWLSEEGRRKEHRRVKDSSEQA